MSTNLSREQEVRVAALREANYYFGFTAGLKRPAALDDTAPVVRARDVLSMADVFYKYLWSGKMPEGISG